MSNNSSVAKPHYPLYLGGLAACIATLGTHPLDLVKVQLQSDQVKGNIKRSVSQIIQKHGIRGFYQGISAGLLRQATYSTARFGAYDAIKARLTDGNKQPPFYQLILASSAAGAIGGIAGNPADLINIRMQNDQRLPHSQKRNYRHAVDGIFKIVRTEGGLTALMKGVRANTTRAVLMTSSQLACYDLIKGSLLEFSCFDDSLITHFSSSLLAGVIATTVCSPIDVIKTRIMGGTSCGTSSVFATASELLKSEGLMSFFKGWIPSFARLGPQTILTFVVLEQLRNYYNYFLKRGNQILPLNPDSPKALSN